MLVLLLCVVAASATAWSRGFTTFQLVEFEPAPGGGGHYSILLDGSPPLAACTIHRVVTIYQGSGFHKVVARVRTDSQARAEVDTRLTATVWTHSVVRKKWIGPPHHRHRRYCKGSDWPVTIVE
jgi:hypothetical protein